MTQTDKSDTQIIGAAYSGGAAVTIDSFIAQAIKYGRQAILLALLLLLAVIILRQFGIQLPIRSPDHITLAYICGAYWLTK